MNCAKINSKLADLLFEPEAVPAEVREHVAQCEACSRELHELKATMGLLDEWHASDLSPYFDTRLMARLREERAAQPAGFLERLKAQLLFGSNFHVRPVAALALTVVMVVGGGTYLSLTNWENHPPQPQASATVHDLQSLDRNAQVFEQLADFDQETDD